MLSVAFQSIRAGFGEGILRFLRGKAAVMSSRAERKEIHDAWHEANEAFYRAVFPPAGEPQPSLDTRLDLAADVAKKFAAFTAVNDL
jgi:hypothetical protein